jgi:hypothetical protein
VRRIGQLAACREQSKDRLDVGLVTRSAPWGPSTEFRNYREKFGRPYRKMAYLFMGKGAREALHNVLWSVLGLNLRVFALHLNQKGVASA